MPYPALPDHRIPYDNDGTIVYTGSTSGGATTQLNNAQLLELQDEDNAVSALNGGPAQRHWWFFPCQTEVTGIIAWTSGQLPLSTIQGSNDTTNGQDGTWETASLPGGAPSYVDAFSWRSGIKAVSFTGPKKTIRIHSAQNTAIAIVHLYGEAAGGQMAHDLVFLDPDLGAGVAFPAAEDFGDQPLGTTVVRPFRIKNTSASVTATDVNIQCNDADFTIATSGSGPWVQTIDIASLAAGAESSTMYVKCTTPAPGAALLPRVARIIVTCDLPFFG